MTRIRPFGVALVLGMGVAGVACEDHASTSSSGAAPSASAAASTTAAAPSASASASAAPAAPAVTDAAAAAMAEEDEKLSMELRGHHRHHHTGFGGIVLMSVDTLGVNPDQQEKIDKIKAEFHKGMKPLHEANKAVALLLADGIAAGKIETAKVDAAVAKASAGANEAHVVMDTELNQLHAALKPEQRAALVEKVEAQWNVWKEANAIDQAADNDKKDGHLKHFAKEYALTDDQVAKAKTALDAVKDAKKAFEPKAADEHIAAFATAFVADTFDAKKLPEAKAENAKVVAWGSERMARFYEAVTPILTADQRTKVAEHLRHHEIGTPNEGKP